jgi:hypothetical protein
MKAPLSFPNEQGSLFGVSVNPVSPPRSMRFEHASGNLIILSPEDLHRCSEGTAAVDGPKG